MTEPKPDAAELRHKIADGIPPSLIDSPAVGVGAARRLKLADAMLSAVEYAGYVITTPDRLLPADAETRTEWTVKVNGNVMEAYAGITTEANCRAIAADPPFEGHEVIVVSRFAARGPWLPAPTTEES